MFPRASQHPTWWAGISTGLILLFAANATSASVINGTLGTWLQQVAGPKLVSVLGTHPRFSGEQLSVVTMRDGSPTGASNQLNRALEDAVTHRLLEQQQVRVTWRQQQQHCGVPQAVPYLLGVEINPTSRDRAQVSIAVVDVQENIWVPGLHLRWTGTLTRAQQRALTQTQSRAATGSMDQPIAISQAAPISEQLFGQIKCALPKGVGGSVFVATQNGATLEPVMAALRQRLQRSALFSLSDAQGDADWLLNLRPVEATGHNARLDVILNAVEGSSAQQLGSVYVQALGEDTAQRTAKQTVTGEPAPAPSVQTVPTTLLSELVHTETSPCQQRDDQPCASIALEVLQPAYVLIFRTQDGELSGPQCSAELKRSPASRKRYRLPLSAALDTGFYVIASANRDIARAFHKHLRRAPGHCRNKPLPVQPWLTELQRLLASHNGAIEWRAVHLRDDAALKVAAIGVGGN